MDCWIGVITEAERRIVRVAGHFGVVHVPELLAACAGVKSLEIDLTDLVSADAPGVEALKNLRLKGATLAGTSGYIQLKLDTRG